MLIPNLLMYNNAHLQKRNISFEYSNTDYSKKLTKKESDTLL